MAPITAETAPATDTQDAFPRWLRPLGLIALFSLLLLAWTIFVHASNAHDPWAWGNLLHLSLEPYLVGIAAQEMLLPVALLFLFSRSRLFRRAIGAENGIQLPSKDYFRLFLILVAGQLVYGLYLYGLIRSTENSITLGVFFALLAGLLGGLPAGVAIGALAALTIGALSYFPWPNQEPIPWYTFFEWYVLRNVSAVAALWVGAVAGVAAPWLRWPPRFALWKLLLLGLGMELFVTFCVFLGSDSDIYSIEPFVPNAAITALALVALYLMIRDVQNEETRRHVEAAQLELTQANLALTQTKLALAQAELRALHAQINPHFLFNSLNTIRYFVRTDPAVARDLLTNLSEVFQRVLSAGEFVALREEISHVEAYLALEKARLDERLQVIWTNLARDALDIAVPTLVLQPVVENAVIHGIAPKPEGGTVHILINRAGGDLLIQIADNGVGFDPVAWGPSAGEAMDVQAAPPVRNGIGLRNVDERLRLLYGDAYRLAVDSRAGEGTRVVIHIPLENGAGEQP
jgi:anti-sigma regulatory factor (Ser/Thr protein kinase)